MVAYGVKLIHTQHLLAFATLLEEYNQESEDWKQQIQFLEERLSGIN
jgi:hypothetical protein